VHKHLKKNPKFFFGFSDPANFLHQPPSSSSLKKNPKFFWGFSDPANSGKKKILAGKKRHITTGKKKDTIVIPKHLKKNPKFFFGFSNPANFLHQPPSSSSLKKNPKFFFGFSDPANSEEKKDTGGKKKTHYDWKKKRYDRYISTS
jgi:muramoyltetrapeptide carboxypeptidase LdcA involved in peptidoglycan recycling